MMGVWVECTKRQPEEYGRYRVRRRVRGRRIEEDEYLWNGSDWVTHGNSLSRAVVEWLDEKQEKPRP